MVSNPGLTEAYQKARFRYIGITLLRALNDPLLYKALTLLATALQKKQENTSQPQPEKEKK